MVDFKNGSFVKLKKVATESVPVEIAEILIPGEQILGAYSALRDSVIFTDKRVISINVQGLTGKKKDYTSMPYSKISVFSIETSGMLDLDSELEMYFSGLGKVTFEFTGQSDIVEIGMTIASFAL